MRQFQYVTLIMRQRIPTIVDHLSPALGDVVDLNANVRVTLDGDHISIELIEPVLVSVPCLPT